MKYRVGKCHSFMGGEFEADSPEQAIQKYVRNVVRVQGYFPECIVYISELGEYDERISTVQFFKVSVEVPDVAIKIGSVEEVHK